jgi:hypothetical protein
MALDEWEDDGRDEVDVNDEEDGNAAEAFSIPTGKTRSPAGSIAGRGKAKVARVRIAAKAKIVKSSQIGSRSTRSRNSIGKENEALSTAEDGSCAMSSPTERLGVKEMVPKMSSVGTRQRRPVVRL